jgi:hypothetical protein
MGRVLEFGEVPSRSCVPAMFPALKRGLGAACERARCVLKDVFCVWLRLVRSARVS